MAITACTSNEYIIYTGGTGATATPHPIYTGGDNSNDIYIQCGMVLLGGDGLYN